ncbi:hypothetical protein BRADI_5g11970v3 [Brachypodium distachyon]|uniref:Uncharacterized protein n=1 Tax=Brachypodium distachyon TaxID=15368 RepID=I1IYC1_BRADI|nr:hypothetical protein BRADI_5g11970v3 [Brachypodium distachyon]
MAMDSRVLPAAYAAPAVDVGVDGAARPWSRESADASSAEGRDMGMGLLGSAVAMDLPVLWDDEGRMKRELVAWAKAVASMAIRESMRC